MANETPTDRLTDEARGELRKRFGRHFFCTKHGHRVEADEVTSGPIRDDGGQMHFGPCGYTVFERPADAPVLALLAEVDRLREENADLQNMITAQSEEFAELRAEMEDMEPIRYRDAGGGFLGVLTEVSCLRAKNRELLKRAESAEAHLRGDSRGIQDAGAVGTAKHGIGAIDRGQG